MKFCNIISHHDKSFIKILFHKLKRNVNSLIGNNLRHIMLEINMNTIDQIDSKLINNLVYFDIPTGEEYRVTLLKELIDVKNNLFFIPGFSFVEIDFMINHVCTT